MNPQTQSQSNADANRPAVVLAGWLGCRPRNLRRYIQMYDKNGLNSLVRTGSPKSVVVAMTEGPFTSKRSSQSEMKHLAIDTLQELQNNQPRYFILHIFSNNGCFLWEWIRSMLYGQQSPLPPGSNIDIHNLRQKLVGVIFDSAPAYYGGEEKNLELALQFVPSTTERSQLLEIAKSLDAHVVKQRFRDFWGGLCDDSASIPQLYLYSQCDNLAPVDQLEKLIICREKMLRKGNVLRHNFLDSEHCSHLLKYPVEYERLVKQFLALCGTHICGVQGSMADDNFTRSRL